VEVTVLQIQSLQLQAAVREQHLAQVFENLVVKVVVPQ
jgi:hypothetical protein